MVGIPNNTNWYNTYEKKVRIKKITRTSENFKTIQINYGMYSSFNKIHAKASGTVRTPTPASIQKQHKNTKQLRLERKTNKRLRKNQKKIPNKHYGKQNKNKTRCE